MPAAVTKTEESIKNNVGGSLSSDSPIRQAIIIIEHKIRNLEKRKTKLESYRVIQFSGKELSHDQKTAVAKYNEVTQSLELARDFVKQLGQLSNNYEKEVKKQIRKDAILRAQQETSKIREVLILQDTLKYLKKNYIREELVEGTNKSIQLTEKEINLLNKFVSDVDIPNIFEMSYIDDGKADCLQKIAEFLSLTVDGRSKIYFEDFTFENLKELLNKIRVNGLNQTKALLTKDNQVHERNEVNVNPCSTVENSESLVHSNSSVETEFKSEAPSATILPTPTFGNLSNTNISERLYTNDNEALNKLFTSNDALEQSVFNEQTTNMHVKPLSEVIGCSNFFFIQDSEIDTHEHEEQDSKKEDATIQENQMNTIQSQTFTNQSMISNDNDCSVEKNSQRSSNSVENFNQPFLKVDSPNASNLPMPGFLLGKDKLESKNENDTEWKTQANEYDSSKWNAFSDHKHLINRPFPRTNVNDRIGNLSRSQHSKHNGLRGSNHYYKTNDTYYYQGPASNNFRSRNCRDKGNERGNSYLSRSQK